MGWDKCLVIEDRGIQFVLVWDWLSKIGFQKPIR